MHLVIDLGNSKIKFFVFQENRILYRAFQPIIEWENTLRQIRKKYPAISNCIISDVNGSITDDLKNSLGLISVLFCSSRLKLPFRTMYKPKKQLGADRIALLSACILDYPNKNVLVIDLGTCITYDLIDNKRLHHGGAISPGFIMRYKSLNFFTGSLPLLNPKISDKFLGDSTKSSIHAGVTNGIIAEINERICYHKKNFKDLIVIFSGGDALRLSKPFKNEIFADTNFLAKGLNSILVSNLS
tara:strand:- start:22126 stop:22854 length:729 start_codon:yes stop_codon:yes gene_type:complete